MPSLLPAGSNRSNLSGLRLVSKQMAAACKTGLLKLKIDWTRLTKTVRDPKLEGFPALTHLHVHTSTTINQRRTEGCEGALFSLEPFNIKSPNITSITLTGCTLNEFYCNRDLSVLFRPITGLKVLTLDHVEQFKHSNDEPDDGDVTMAVDSLQQLEELTVKNSTAFDFLNISNLLKLHTVTVRNNDSLRDIIFPKQGGRLHKVYCTHNAISTLDLSNTPKLTQVTAKNNVRMTELNATDCTNLRTVQSSGNTILVGLLLEGCSNLTGLDVQLSPSLTEVDVSSSKLVQNIRFKDLILLDRCLLADLSNSLYKFHVENTALPSQNLSHHIRLKSVHMESNPRATSLSTRGCSRLKMLYAHNNGAIIRIDTSSTPCLDHLSVRGEHALTAINMAGTEGLYEVELHDSRALSVIDLKGQLNLRVLKCSHMHSLQSIDVSNSISLYRLELISNNQLSRIRLGEMSPHKMRLKMSTAFTLENMS